MYSEPFEDYLTSEFNRTHAGLNELIQAEKHSLDILDEQPNMASLLDDDHAQMVAQREAGDFEGLLYFEVEERFKPFVRRHQRKAMEKGFELRGAENYHKLFALWLEQREECEPFHQRHCLYFDLYTRQWEDIPF